MAAPRFTVTYRVRSDAASIEARAQSIAIEQSVEMPLSAIVEQEILRDIVGEVEAIDDRGGGVFDVRIGLATATTGGDAGQFLNMLFGNTSLHEDVVLLDVDVPAEPGRGIRRPAPWHRRPAPPRRRIRPRADLLGAEAAGPAAGAAGANWRNSSPAAASTSSRTTTAWPTRPIRRSPNASPRIAGSVGTARAMCPACRAISTRCARQIDIALRARHRHGDDRADDRRLVARSRRWCGNIPDLAFFAHPTMGGAARIAPDLLIGKLFRLLGADAVIFPNHGGRFGYTPDTCRRLAEQARAAVGRHPAQRAGARRRHDAGAGARDA